ncbi:MAG TPA: thioredoxin family protein [Panacibacter sp.]|nr:thioredoxin family protein [Panacibacter sp.]HNP46666.1 thioredoxin family protein [Panacibacter sp.]
MITHLKKLAFISLVFYASISNPLNAQSKKFDISYDTSGQKVLTGLLTRADIASDTAFKWFAANMKLGAADAAAIAAFQKNAAKFQVVIFAGTWCEDSQNLLPVFYRLADKSGYPDSSITLIGLDRNKKTLNNLHAVFNVTHTPTFIVMKDGKEIGRVVEYGKYGQVDKELGEIVRTIE